MAAAAVRRGRAWGGAEAIVGWLLLGAALVVHAIILMQHPVVGAAENGDFSRVTRPAGIVSIDSYESVHHKYVSQHYGVAPSRLTVLFSSAAVIATAAKWLRPGAPDLDIRQVGAVYLLLVALTFALALLGGVAPLCCALLAWAALDVSYALYFNSFFTDAAALVGFLGVVLALLAADRGAAGTARRALLLAAALLAGFSKHLYMLTPLVAAIAIAAWPRAAWRAHLRAEAPLLAALLLGAALTTWHFAYGSGARFPDINNHHAVCHGLATVVDDPPALLAELGLEPGLAPLVGRSYFALSRDEQALSRAALADLSRARLAAGYLRTPDRMRRALGKAAVPMRDVVSADPNFADRSRPAAKYTGWWQFARLRGHLPVLAALLLIAGVAALGRAAATRTWNGLHAAFVFLLLNATLLVVGSVLGDGFFGLPRHTMGTRFCLDLALALMLYAGVARLSLRPAPSR